jgi:L-iditol 2-dehydrogenase
VKLARALGAGRVFATDLNEYRLQAARRFGADAAINAEEDVPSRLKEVNENRLADLVIVCTSASKAFSQALQSADRGGTVEFFAPTMPGINIPISIYALWSNDITLMTSYAASPMDLAMSLELIRTGRVKVHDMITHRLGLEETGLGFKLVAKADKSIKVIIEPNRL